MSKKTKKLLNDYITKHSQAFVPGATFSHKQFRRRFNWLVPGLNKADPIYTRDAGKYTTAYGAINRVLAHRGLYMKSVNYYSSFEIIEDSSKKLKDYDNRIKGTMVARVNLDSGIKRHRMQWSSLSSAELDRVAPMVVRHIPSY